jgi:hypothetical protein
VIQSGEEQESVIEVQFEDKNFYKQFKIKNSNNYSLAALNYRGLVLASKGQSDANDNEYQKEDENLDLISRVYF